MILLPLPQVGRLGRNKAWQGPYMPVIAKSIAAIISSLIANTDPTGLRSNFAGIEAN